MPGLICNFCGKDEDEVRNIVAGPAVYICDECVDLCQQIIFDMRRDNAIRNARELAFIELYGTD